jgi:outer membrane protein TolC
VAQAESNVANAQLALVEARGQLDGAIATLNETLGVERWRPMKLVAPPDALPPPMEKNAVDSALASRPEPRQLKLQARAYEEQQRSLRGAWLPALGVSAGPSWAGTTWSGLATNFSIAVTLSSTLNPTLIHGQQLEAEATAAQLEEQARAARLGVELDVANASIAIDTARGEIVAAKVALDAAKEQRDLANERFLQGLGTTLDLSDAESNYIAAQGQFIQAKLDLGLAGVKLDRAMGTM